LAYGGDAFEDTISNSSLLPLTDARGRLEDRGQRRSEEDWWKKKIVGKNTWIFILPLGPDNVGAGTFPEEKKATSRHWKFSEEGSPKSLKAKRACREGEGERGNCGLRDQEYSLRTEKEGLDVLRGEEEKMGLAAPQAWRVYEKKKFMEKGRGVSLGKIKEIYYLLGPGFEGRSQGTFATENTRKGNLQPQSTRGTGGGSPSNYLSYLFLK